MAAALFNITEAAFKVMHPIWIVFLLAITEQPALEGVGAPSPTE